jgi:3-oxo-5-alpha-steroid 4-dehydrogenase 1
MTEQILFNTLLWTWFVLAAVTLPALFVVAAPYGRHTRGGWGPTVGDRLGWVVMEAPAALVFAACFWVGDQPPTAAAIVLFCFWEAHYVHRAFLYPLSLRSRRDGRLPVAIAGMAFLFNTVNGYLNGRSLTAFSPGYGDAWLSDPRFLVGVALFVAGYLINRQADRTLRGLRQPGESGYRIPHGGLYRWVSCPNYLGEIIEWVGWAVATWSLPGLAFAVWVIANLAPRARSHHRWYRERFPDYPDGRKALVPGLW